MIKTIPTLLVSAPCCPAGCSEHGSQKKGTHFNDDCVFQVKWSINPHMKIGASSASLALKQHTLFTRALKDVGARVVSLPFVHGAYDSVFIKDSAILKRSVQGVSALIANPKYEVRQIESEKRHSILKNQGVEVTGQARKNLEGGDVVVSHRLNKVFMGYGFRSSKESALDLSHFLDMEVLPLELVDPQFYHLDVALSILEDGTTFACREAFTESSWNILRSAVGAEHLIPVSRKEALSFGLNWVEVGSTVVMGSYESRLMDILLALGKKIRYTPLDQFQFAGGSAACLVAPVYDFHAPARREKNTEFFDQKRSSQQTAAYVAGSEMVNVAP